jgi:hypothetical protein
VQSKRSNSRENSILTLLPLSLILGYGLYKKVFSPQKSPFKNTIVVYTF